MNLSNKNLAEESFTNSFKSALVPFLLSRLLLILVFLFGTSFILLEHQDDSVLRPQVRISNLTKTISNLDKNIIVGDAGWYLGIIKRGYSTETEITDVQRNWAFFPLFPATWKLTAKISGEYVYSGLFLSNIFLFFSLALLHRLLRHSELSPEIARLSLWLLCFFPTSYFLSLPLTESLFLFLVVCSALLVRTGQPFFAAIVFALATGTRPTGLLMAPAFLFYLFQNGYKPIQSMLLSVTIAPLGIVLYSAYLYSLTGNPLAWMEIQKAWRPGGFPDIDLANPILLTDWNFVSLNIIAGLLSLAAGLAFLKNRNLAAALLVTIPVAASLWTGSTLSLARHALNLFPIFPLLAAISVGRNLERVLLTIFSVGLGIMTLLFSLKATSALT